MHASEEARNVESSPRISGATEQTREPQYVEKYRIPSALVIHESLRVEGQEQLSRSGPSLLWSGLAGGLSMGLCMSAAGLVHAYVAPAPWRVLLTGIAFTLGFIVVIIGRQGLITESALTGVLPTLTRPSVSAASRLAKVWGLVLVANLVGAALFAFVAARTTLFAPEVQHAFKELGHRAMEGSWTNQFVQALFAGWAIALALWLSPAAGGARLFVIVLLIAVVGAGHMGHIVSGSVEVLTVVFSGAESLTRYVTHFLFPVLLGNLLGGAVLVAAINHAQVRHEQAVALPELRRSDRPARRREVHA